MNIRRLTDTGEWTTRRYLSLLGNILIWAIVAIDGFYLWPTQLHGSTSMVIVSGHSMEPTYFTGDLVIARKMEPSVGDVIVYAPDGFGGSQIVHRVVGGNATDGWVMKGDNNPNPDPFTPKGSEIKGVVLVHYANFGRVTVLLLNPIMWALVLLAAVVLLVWWSGDTCEDDPDDKDNDRRADGSDPEPEAEEEPDLIDRIVEGTEAAVARMVASGADAGAAVLAALTRPSPSPRHATRTPRRGAPALLRVSAIVAVVGLASVFGISPASASSLNINAGGNLFTKTYMPCTTTALTATPSTVATGTNYTKLVVSGIPAACNRKSITMYAYDTSGVLLMSSGLSASPPVTTGTGGTVTFTKASSSYNAAAVSNVLVFIDTWGVQTTWAYTPPASPLDCVGIDLANPSSTYPCTPSVDSTNTWTDRGYTYTNLKFKAVTSAPIWQITFDLSSTTGGFTGMSPVRWVGTYQNVVLAPNYNCNSLPVFVGREANPQWGSDGGEITFSNDPAYANGTQLCNP